MKTFVGVVDGKSVSLKGETVKDAMEAAGMTPQTKYTSGNKYVGQLTDGRRYSIKFQERKDPYEFGIRSRK